MFLISFLLNIKNVDPINKNIVTIQITILKFKLAYLYKGIPPYKNSVKSQHTVGNQASLYNGMTEYIDGDLRFINPWKNNNLHPDKAEYLKYIILELNKNLHPTWSEAQIQQKINDNDVEFF
jgi:hypothetical protein